MKEYPYLQDAIANTVEYLRKGRKMTKIALADFACLQDCYIREITKGKRNPTITTIYSICDALEISPVNFLDKVEQERQRLLTLKN